MVIMYTPFIIIIVNIMLSLTRGLYPSFQTPLSLRAHIIGDCGTWYYPSNPEVNCPAHSSLTPDPAPDGSIPPFHSYKEYSTYPTYPYSPNDVKEFPQKVGSIKELSIQILDMQFIIIFLFFCKTLDSQILLYRQDLIFTLQLDTQLC